MNNIEDKIKDRIKQIKEYNLIPAPYYSESENNDNKWAWNRVIGELEKLLK